MKEERLPTYDFQCKSCGNLVEVQTREPIPCTFCGETMVRLYTAVPIHFKGTGFYKTGG